MNTSELDCYIRTTKGRQREIVIPRAQQACDTWQNTGWLGRRVVSVLDSGAEVPGFKSQLRRCRVTVLGKLFTHIVPLFTKQRNW